MLLYPNPVRTEVNIKADSLGEVTAHVGLYDMNGRAVKEVNYTVSNTQEALMSISGISKGMYIIEIVISKVSIRKKLIVE